ncbi:MAG TPA: flagellar type III secretion system pore protein FliP [Terracidiphilus sp.]|nr:flagellar type III secretion system pore protein FliP [Terracidiphilus sp.]
MTFRHSWRRAALFASLLAFAVAAPLAHARPAQSQSGLDNWTVPAPSHPALRSAAIKPISTHPVSTKQTSIAPSSLKSPAAGGTGLQIQGLPGSSVPWSIVIMLTALTLIPSLLLCVTPFARLLIVFHFLRQALGLQTTPSNQTLIGLSLILTFFLMHPVATQIYETAIVPAESGQVAPMDAIKLGEGPLRKFMTHYVRDKDVALFVDLAKEPRPASVNDLSMHILLPAYILSELKAGFQIGTVLFLPFLIVDMVVASITTSVGMFQLPPVVISTPLKLLLFLMVDGWHLLIGSLIRSFN